MKNFLKSLIPALIVGFALFPIANAQVSNPQWRINTPSSTITPINSSLQVPCANIVGGCGGGNVTSTNGLVNTGNVTSTSFTAATSSPSLLPNLDNILFADGYGGADIGAKINSAIAAATTNPIIIVTASSSYTTPIVAGAGKFPLIECSPGVNLQYTGATSTPSITFNGGTGTKYQWGLIGCLFTGTSQFGGQTGLLIGGTAGADSITIQGNKFTQFNIGGEGTANVNWANINGNTFNFDQTAWDWVGGANSGEQIRYVGNTFADCNNPINCVANPGGYSSVYYGLNSIDDAQLSFGTSGAFGATLDHNHFENPAALSNPNLAAYPMLSISSDTAALYNEDGDVFVLDAQGATSTPTSTIVNDSNLVQTGVAWFKNGATIVKNAVDTSGSTNATLSQRGDTNENSAFTNYASSTNATTSLAYENILGTQVQLANLQNLTQNMAALQIGSSPIAGSSVSGAALGANPTSYSGDWINFEINGVEKFLIQNNGKIVTYSDNSFENGNSYFGGGSIIMDAGGANFQGNVTGNGYYAGSWTVGTSTAGTATLNVEGASSTILLGVPSKYTGCVEGYDNAASGTKDYAYFSSTALVVTSTKPTFCK